VAGEAGEVGQAEDRRLGNERAADAYDGVRGQRWRWLPQMGAEPWEPGDLDLAWRQRVGHRSSIHTVAYGYGIVWFVPAPVQTSYDAWVDAGLSALALGGPEFVRVESVAAALGVTKGGFYHHFADRRALLAAMLARWESQLVDHAIEVVEDRGGDARDRLRTLFGYAGSSPHLLAVELAVRDWARREPEVATRLARVDERRMDFLRMLFAEVCKDSVDPVADAEARCLLTMALFVGQPFLAVTHGDRRREEVLHDAVALLLGAEQIVESG
jgi:AcrR family transcriptional regulator